MSEVRAGAVTRDMHRPPPLRARRMGIHTQHETVVFMRTDCHVCRSEGLTASSRVLLRSGGQACLATLYQVSSDILGHDEAGLSESAWERLQVADGAEIHVSHPEPIESFRQVRSRIYGNRLEGSAFRSILTDVAAGRYSDIELSAFIAGSSALRFDHAETIALTRAMVEIGQRLSWPGDPIVDKHCVGGLPGNRTTPIVVAIVAAQGLVIPKTSSRAITSPAGTADAMETMAPVDLSLSDIHRVVDAEGGCVAWGGAVHLSPADDVLIRVERALDLDSEGQLVASVMSKKIAAGATLLVIDMPVGPTAKVRSDAAADALEARIMTVAKEFGLATSVIRSDGMQPVGRGIGPALEARDVLSVLRQEPSAPADLHDRACTLAGAILELAGIAAPGEGVAAAEATVADGRAWAKFQRICQAQGGMREPPTSRHRAELVAPFAGTLTSIDNRRLAKLAKLAGAPEAKAAGVVLNVRLSDDLAAGQPLCTVHTQTVGELEYALDYSRRVEDIFCIERN
jgi:thymidine phosphorylase